MTLSFSSGTGDGRPDQGTHRGHQQHSTDPWVSSRDDGATMYMGERLTPRPAYPTPLGTRDVTRPVGPLRRPRQPLSLSPSSHWGEVLTGPVTDRSGSPTEYFSDKDVVPSRGGTDRRSGSFHEFKFVGQDYHDYTNNEGGDTSSFHPLL